MEENLRQGLVSFIDQMWQQGYGDKYIYEMVLELLEDVIYEHVVGRCKNE